MYWGTDFLEKFCQSAEAARDTPNLDVMLQVRGAGGYALGGEAAEHLLWSAARTRRLARSCSPCLGVDFRGRRVRERQRETERDRERLSHTGLTMTMLQVLRQYGPKS